MLLKLMQRMSLFVQIKIHSCAVITCQEQDRVTALAVHPQREASVTCYQLQKSTDFHFPHNNFSINLCDSLWKNLAQAWVIKGRRLSSIKFIIQVFAEIHQKDNDDDDGRCTMILYCMEFICFATK